jgi:hypothetical protein
MGKVKIKFVDFWFGFIPDKNYFFKLLSQSYDLVLCDDPDILIYSCYGTEYLKYDCIKVFFTAENLRPDFTGCDYAISFDYNNDPRHFRLPLYALYIDQTDSLEKLIQKKTRSEALEIWRSKTKFCCMVVSNGQSKKRLNFFEKLSKYKTVDSGGAVMNNVGGPVKDKLDFIKDYRFVIAFENACHPGYTTEKILEPFVTGSIPLYWGNPVVGKEFNTGCFLNLDNSKSEEAFINEIIAIDKDEEKAVKMLMEPKFANGHVPDDINKGKLGRFFEQIITNTAHKIPVSKTKNKYIHLYKIRKNYYANRIKGLLERFI